MSGPEGARRRNNLPVIITVVALFAAAAAVFMLMGNSARGRDRRVFLFPSQSSSTSGNNPIKEARYLSSEGRDPLAVYISELLLGSSGQTRAQPFASKCELNRCFASGNAAYIDINASDFEKTVSDPFFSYKCALFKKNVFTNFRNIDRIYLYFDGVEVYAEKH